MKGNITNVTDSYRYAIRTNYLGPTNTMGARISATMDSPRERVVVGYDHAISISENHARAAVALVAKLWERMPRTYEVVNLIQGAYDGGYVFVFED